MKPLNFGYKDEMWATGMVLGLTVVGSFFFANQYMGNAGEDEVVRFRTISTEKIAPTPDPAVAQNEQVLGSNVVLSPTPQVGLQAIPTLGSDFTEVGFGYGGMYDHPGYKLELSSPRIRIQKNTSSSRLFVVDLALTNLAIAEGIPNRIGARVVKDGAVVAEDAAMTVTPLGLVPQGARVSFQASISLIEGTDVDQVIFKPEGLKEVLHMLNP